MEGVIYGADGRPVNPFTLQGAHAGGPPNPGSPTHQPAFAGAGNVQYPPVQIPNHSGDVGPSPGLHRARKVNANDITGLDANEEDRAAAMQMAIQPVENTHQPVVAPVESMTVSNGGAGPAGAPGMAMYNADGSPAGPVHPGFDSNVFQTDGAPPGVLKIPGLQFPQLQPSPMTGHLKNEIAKRDVQIIEVQKQLAAAQAEVQRLRMEKQPQGISNPADSGLDVGRLKQQSLKIQADVDRQRGEIQKACKQAKKLNQWFIENATRMKITDTTSTPSAYLERYLECTERRLNGFSAGLGNVVSQASSIEATSSGMVPGVANPGGMSQMQAQQTQQAQQAQQLPQIQPFQPGTAVEYFSVTKGGVWLSGVVQNFDPQNKTYQLNLIPQGQVPQAAPENVRLASAPTTPQVQQAQQVQQMPPVQQVQPVQPVGQPIDRLAASRMHGKTADVQWRPGHGQAQVLGQAVEATPTYRVQDPDAVAGTPAPATQVPGAPVRPDFHHQSPAQQLIDLPEFGGATERGAHQRGPRDFYNQLAGTAAGSQGSHGSQRPGEDPFFPDTPTTQFPQSAVIRR